MLISINSQLAKYFPKDSNDCEEGNTASKPNPKTAARRAMSVNPFNIKCHSQKEAYNITYYSTHDQLVHFKYCGYTGNSNA